MKKHFLSYFVNYVMCIFFVFLSPLHAEEIIVESKGKDFDSALINASVNATRQIMSSIADSDFIKSHKKEIRTSIIAHANDFVKDIKVQHRVPSDSGVKLKVYIDIDSNLIKQKLSKIEGYHPISKPIINQNDYAETDLKTKIEACDLGKNSIVCLDVAQAYEKGINGAEKDFDKAVKFYEIACEEKNEKACYRLSEIYYTISLMIQRIETDIQNTDDNDVKNAMISISKEMENHIPNVELINKGCDIEIGLSCAAAGNLSNTSRNVKKYKQGIKLSEKGCSLESGIACSDLGAIYEEGKSVKQDLEKSEKYLKLGVLYSEKNCEKGSGIECGNAGLSYLMGEGTEKNYIQAIKLLEKGCELDSDSSCFFLAFIKSSDFVYDNKDMPTGLANDSESSQIFHNLCISDGLWSGYTCMLLGINKFNENQYEQAVQYLDKACSKGIGYACDNIGIYTSDITQKLEYLRKGCDLDYSISCNKIINIYIINMINQSFRNNGNKNEISVMPLVEFFEKECVSDNSYGCVAAYDNYNNITSNDNYDFNKAQFYIKHACELKNGLGCLGLVDGYSNGSHGFEKNQELASTNIQLTVNYLKSSCEESNSNSEIECVVLSYILIQTGYLDAAMKYLENICYIGNNFKGDACIALGDIYKNGNENLESDIPMAVKYYEKACQAGFEQACENLKLLVPQK